MAKPPSGVKVMQAKCRQTCAQQGMIRMNKRRWCLAPAAGVVWLCGIAASSAQTCSLVSDDRNPTEKILRCGDTLTIRSAKGTAYHLTGRRGGQQPEGARLDSGALLIEFAPSEAHR